MPKTTFTPRDELVCGKLDILELKLQKLGEVDLIYLLEAIRHDCTRMEAKLVDRKTEFNKLSGKISVNLLEKALL